MADPQSTRDLKTISSVEATVRDILRKIRKKQSAEAKVRIVLEGLRGEKSAAELLAKLGHLAEAARDLAYHLHTVCERKGWAQDALGYDTLVVA